jgi:hypothetical protein
MVPPAGAINECRRPSIVKSRNESLGTVMYEHTLFKIERLLKFSLERCEKVPCDRGSATRKEFLSRSDP